jgi:hypothetical protein
VASSKDEEIVGREEFVGEECDEALQRLVVPACIVSDEEIVHELGMSAAIKDMRQFLIIPQRPGADMYRPIYPKQSRFLQTIFPNPSAKLYKLFLTDLGSFKIGFD